DIDGVPTRSRQIETRSLVILQRARRGSTCDEGPIPWHPSGGNNEDLKAAARRRSESLDHDVDVLTLHAEEVKPIEVPPWLDRLASNGVPDREGVGDRLWTEAESIEPQTIGTPHDWVVLKVVPRVHTEEVS